MDRPAGPPDPPYRRIADEIRQRIAAGTLRTGDRVPSTRQIVQEEGVAMATASKVLATLRQEGLVQALPGVGTVVAARSRTTAMPRPAVRPTAAKVEVSGPPGTNDQNLTRDRVIRAAIKIADAEGLAALSMRRVAAELAVSTMALYRHVAGKEELILLMADAAFGEHSLPESPPPGWRARLELIARLQWAIYRLHPWLAQAMSFTRPLLIPSALAHAEWAMRAMADLDLDPITMIHVHVTLANYTRGTAVNFESEAQARQDTGITDEQWMESRGPAMAELLASGDFPVFAATVERLQSDLDLDSLFEFGLRRLLDGLTMLPGTPGS